MTRLSLGYSRLHFAKIQTGYPPRPQPSDGLISTAVGRLWSYVGSAPTESSLAQSSEAVSSKPYSIHSTMLPTLNTTLCEALVTELRFGNASEYIYAETDLINNIVQVLLKFPKFDTRVMA
jgi:hypothetical protein